jgi:hypothetical protein
LISKTPSFFVMIPFSVAIAEIRLAGVTSNAGFQQSIPGAAISTVQHSPLLARPLMFVISFAALCSISIPAPVAVFMSIDVQGAATMNGTLWYLAQIASWYVPILFAVSALDECTSVGSYSVCADHNRAYILHLQKCTDHRVANQCRWDPLKHELKRCQPTSLIVRSSFSAISMLEILCDVKFANYP